MTTAITRTSHGTWPRELLVLRRDRGYLRVHVPPLLYAPSLAPKLEKSLLAVGGVRRVVADRHRARLSVFYDRFLVDDRALLEIVRAAATPLLGRKDERTFGAELEVQEQARLERIQGKAVQGAYLGLLGWAHWHVLRWALRDPVSGWWAWALLGFGVYTHRNQIRRIPEVSP